MKRLALMLVLVLGAAGALAASAAADKPDKVTFYAEGSAPDIGVCAFPVAIHVRADYVATYFYDQSGVLVRIHQDAQYYGDVFTGPTGVTLTGLPYHQEEFGYYDPDGAITKAVFNGVEKVPLPDGSTAIVGGHTVTTYPDATTVVKGPNVNMDKFCAALAP